MKNIDAYLLANITGGVLGTAPTRRSSSSSSSLQLQTALTGVTSALDSLKNQNKSGSLEQLLPVALMARWIQNR